MVVAGSVSETSSSPKIYATLSRRRKGESGHLWRSFRLALAGENRGFPFPRPAPYVCDDPVTAWDWSLEDATVARAQITHHDATICHHYQESLWDGVEILDRPRDGSTTLAQSVGLEAGVNCVSG